ncbi:MAG: FxDxF family PEP-CTERM protein [Methylophilus sp.]|nr:FxDxF family PEP-CTERM protein [Methylophilus sp.]
MLKSTVFAILSFSCLSAYAANNTAVLTITQEDGTVWQEDISKLIVVDNQNNFTMLQGQGTTGLFQNGSLVDTIDNAVHPDFWEWKVDAATNVGSWNWHSSQTNSGATEVTGDDLWMAALSLTNVSGHGDPDISYAYSAVNNNTYNQTYTFAIGEAIVPVSSSNNVHADIAGALTAKGGGTATISPFGINTTIQQLELSADNGLSFINAGVNVGPSLSVTGTNNYGVYDKDAVGPTGQTWNYMQLVSKFTLSGNSRASLVGFASIVPVPEPESYAMFLAGLGLLGLASRRRK